MTLSFEGWQQRFAEANGLRPSYLEWGRTEAPPLVFLHGLTTTAHDWDQIAHDLQPDFHVFATDLRGHGDSAWPDPPAYHTDDFVADLTALGEHWGLSRFALVGHSLGAVVAVDYAVSHRETVDRLVVVDSVPLGGVEGGNGPPWASLPYYDSSEAMTEALLKLMTRPAEALVRYSVAHNARELPDSRWTRKHSPDAKSLRMANIWPRAGGIACPTLILRGELSNTFSTADAERLAAAIRDARVETVAGAGHAIMLDQPQAFEAALRRFLQAS